MNRVQMTFRQFLSRSRQYFEEKKEIHIVMGNEASDADSIVSSMVFAWFLTEKAEGRSMYVPVMNIPKQDLELRAEVFSFS
jgi:exopolyphosphatase